MKTRPNTDSRRIDMAIPDVTAAREVAERLLVSRRCTTSWVRMAVVAVGCSEVRAEYAKVWRAQCVAWPM
jgi:hypothetical protein